jgi:tetratricopeptide (TPR) repeat protein
LVVQRLSKSGAQIDFDAEINRIAAQYSTDKNNATTFSLLSVGKMFEKSGNDRAIQNAIRVAEEARQRLLVAEEQFAREQVPLKEARNHVENRRWTEAEEQFTALTQMDSENADYWSGLAFAVENQAGREEEAITIYRKSIERDSKNPDTHYDFARLLQRLERAEDALKEMRSATRLAPGSATFQAGLGSISADQRRYQNALVYYDIATMLSPNDERFLAERKSVGEQVQAHCEDALKADSENVTTRNLLGLSLLAQNKFQEAETVFRASLAKSPESSSSHYGLSCSLNAQRKAQEALEHAEKAYQGGTDGDLYRLELATVLLACGNTRDAYDRLQFGTSPTNATERALLNNAL